MNKWLACALVITTSGCPDIKVDEDETSADPIVEFDPSKSIVPFPNNLLISQTTGKVSLPASCNEGASAKQLRQLGLNGLDGFGSYQTAMSVTLTKPIDPAQLADATFLTEHFLLFKVTADPSMSTQIPVVVIPSSSIRYANQTRDDAGTPMDTTDDILTCDTPNPIDSVALVPRVPLEQRQTYIVAIKTGVKSMDGADYVPSFTWSLVRQPDNPVTLDEMGNVVSDRTPLDPSTATGLASLQGINLLWNAHAPVMMFLGAKNHVRDDILLAWSFKTQTVQDALDPTIAGTPSAGITTTPLASFNGSGTPTTHRGIQLITGTRAGGTYPGKICTDGTTTPQVTAPEPSDVQCFMKLSLGGNPTCGDVASCTSAFILGTGTCAAVGGVNNCTPIGNVLEGTMAAKQYQIDTPNPIAGGPVVPGPWADPVKPPMIKMETVQALLFVPAVACAAAGCPTALYGHGFTRRNEDLFIVAVQMSGAGFALASYDHVAHDSRAVRVTTDAAKGCDTMPPFTVNPNCFAPFFSTNLVATRDNIRQSVVDEQQMVASLKACGITACGTYRVDPTKILYIGQSLGGILGHMLTATSPDVKAAVLNVGAAGWVDLLENTNTFAFSCPLVDGLIDAGSLMGAKYNNNGTPTDQTDDTGLCTTNDWKTQPGYRQFSALGRWLLDPADPGNFSSSGNPKLALKRFFIQEVVGDTVVPNLATDRQAAGAGIMVPAAADPQVSATPAPSAAVTTNPTTSKWLRYTTITTPAPNTFGHGSLLQPPTGSGGGGSLGTLRMQTDAFTWMSLNR